MTRLSRLLDGTIDGGLVFLVVFTPLAFGTVEGWSEAIAQFVVMGVLAAWVLKVTWTPVPRQEGLGPERGRRVLGGRVRLSGLEWPALVFAAVVLLQLVPLPPGWLARISPHTAEVYARSLPGYGSANPSFAELPRWLQREPRPEAGGVPALPPDPDAVERALPGDVFDLPHASWRPVSLTPAHTRRALEVFLAHVAVFVVAFNHWGDRERWQRVLVVLTGMVGVLAVVGIIQSLTADNRLYGWRKASAGAFGPFVNSNNFAGWMELALPVGIGLGLMLWERRRARGEPVTRSERADRTTAAIILVVAAVVLGLAAFLLAGSRGGLVALTAAAALALLAHTIRRRLYVGAALVAAAILLAAIGLTVWIGDEDLWTRYETLGRPTEEPSFLFRIEATIRTLKMAADFPLLGTGFGTFEQAFYLYDPGTSDRILSHTHDDYAQCLAETGVLGAAAMLWALALLVARGVRPGLVRDGSPARWVVRGAAVGVLALLFHALVDFNWQIYSNGLLFVMLSAFLLRHAVARSRPVEEVPA